jgi:lipoprotein-anchoring transpeptidase ErfK/SrfK
VSGWRLWTALILLAVPAAADDFPRAPETVLETQVALARENFSCGSIDGVMGINSESALAAFKTTGRTLELDSPALQSVKIKPDDFAHLQPLSSTFLGKSNQTALDYETLLELISERYHSSPALIRRLNPQIDWTRIAAGDEISVPAAEPARPRPAAARLLIRLSANSLEPLDGDDNLLGHYPVSIAARVEKRPVGELKVTVEVQHPNYTADPINFPESDELRQLDQKLILPPGPNNPVGSVWIGLNQPGYGIHGTPDPEHIGRTESHGCFRLTNWDAEALLDYVSIGTPVDVEK